jgi:protein SCO1/2
MSGTHAHSLLARVIILFLIVFYQNSLSAHVEEHRETKGVGIEERLGHSVPLNLTFRDENGKAVFLRELTDRPTILAPVFFSCPDVCSFLLTNLAGAMNRLPSEPGKDFLVLAISFDETESPPLASEKKRLYLKMIEKPFPEEAWRFLTGSMENILNLTDSIGFHFQKKGKDFLHPVALIVLSPGGKITRYLYGTEILPFDLKMAILEASEGRTGPTIGKALRFCFSYDPKGRKYVFNTLKITGIVTLVFASSFVLFLVWRGRKRNFKKG